jgi:hypothetical protein
MFQSENRDTFSQYEQEILRGPFTALICYTETWKADCSIDTASLSYSHFKLRQGVIQMAPVRPLSKCHSIIH